MCIFLSFFINLALAFSTGVPPISTQTNRGVPPEVYTPTGTAVDTERIDKNTKKTISRHRVCKSIDNQTNLNLLIPLKSSLEWQRFREGAPEEVTFSDCFCGRMLSRVELFAALSSVPWSVSTFAPLAPKVGITPGLYVDAATGERLCQLLNCGPLVSIVGAGYSSPGDNANLRWDTITSAWIKSPANVPSNNHISGSRPDALHCQL